jgi:hypothetical protein
VRKSPGWQPNGIIVCDTADIHLPIISSDGIHGAVVVWYEAYRGADSVNHANYDIYAQRVDSMGNLRWQSQGVPVCSLTTTGAWRPAIVPDGRGGVIVAWAEWGRDSTGYTHVYAQRLDSMGNRLWPENGITVCGQWSGGGHVAMAGDNAGGAVIVWVDGRYSSEGDIFAQRMDSLGNPVWQVDGVPVCTAGGEQWDPMVALNDNGSAFVSWANDYRISTSMNGIYAQLLDSLGIVKWISDGIAVAVDTSYVISVHVLSNGDYGGIIGYRRIGYPQRVQYFDSNGVKHWGNDGVTTGDFSALCKDGGDGVIVYQPSVAQRVDHDGNVRWGAGVSLHAGSSAGHYDACSDGFGGVLAFWDDTRTPPYVHQYMQRVDSLGNLLWTPTGVPACTTVLNVETYLKVTADGVGGGYGTWFGGYVGSLFWPQYNVVMVQRVNPAGVPGGVSGFAWMQPQQRGMRLHIWPDPFRQRTYIQYLLPEPGHARLRIYNIMGQLVRTLDNPAQDAGPHAVEWNGNDTNGMRVAAGVYLCRLQAGSRSATRKIVLVR